MHSKSPTVSNGRGPRKASSQVALEALPSEIKDQIFSYLPQADLYNLLLTSPCFTASITIQLYHEPKFPTTYRFAQFVTTVSHSKRYADMVKILDIPGPGNPWNKESHRATWREWKYRAQPLYAAQFPSQSSAKQHHCYGSHPTRCLFTTSKNDSVLPIGAVVHVLVACQNIRQINIEAEDFERDCRLSSPAYPPTALSSMIFESDVPASWTFRSTETSIIEFGTIIECITRLQLLEKLTLRTDAFLSVLHIADLISRCTKLAELGLSGWHFEFTNLGAYFDGLRTGKYAGPWSLKATRSELIERLTSRGLYPRESTSIGNYERLTPE